MVLRPKFYKSGGGRKVEEEEQEAGQEGVDTWSVTSKSQPDEEKVFPAEDTAQRRKVIGQQSMAYS